MCTLLPFTFAVRQYLPPANEVWGKVIFLHLFVILFIGGYASVHAGIPLPPGPGTPQDQAPLQDHAPPWDHAPPGTMHTPPDQAPPRPGTPLGPCTPPGPCAPPGPGTPRTSHPQDQSPPQDQAPPRPAPSTPNQCRACWEIRSTYGWYTSYLNAILFQLRLTPFGINLF